MEFFISFNNPLTLYPRANHPFDEIILLIFIPIGQKIFYCADILRIIILIPIYHF